MVCCKVCNIVNMNVSKDIPGKLCGVRNFVHIAECSLTQKLMGVIEIYDAWEPGSGSWKNLC